MQRQARVARVVIVGAVAVMFWGLVARAAMVPTMQAPKLDFVPELTVELDVASLDRSIEFYTTKLGFQLTERRDDLKFAHIQTKVPGVDIGLSEVPNPKPSAVTLNFSVKDVDASRKALEAVGVVFRGKTLVIPGKVVLAGFSDHDGHHIRLAGPPKPVK